MTAHALVVLGDADERFLAAAVLRDALPGMQITEAGDAIAFATSLGRADLKVAVVARELSWADGHALVRLLRERHPECATILLGEPEPDLTDPATQPDAHLSRSTTGLARLGQAVQRAIERRAAAPRGAAGPASHDDVPVAVLHLSPDERVRSANAAAAALFGYADAPSLVGRAFADLIQPQDGAGVANAIAAGTAAAAAGRGVFVRPRDGTPLACRLVVRTETRAGVLSGFVAALLPQPADVGSGARALLYAISHDLQQPLLTATQSAQMLSDRLRARARLGRKEERMLRRILSGTSRMETLMNGLLEYVRTGQNPVHVEPIDLGEVTEDVVQGLQSVLNASNGSVRWESLPVIAGSREEITRLVENLVLNAIKFRSEEPPLIEIDCVDRGDSWLLSVRDNGVGIDAAQAERIFEPFQRLRTEAEIPGSGIGLAICRQICERHGGRIWVTPNADRGSTFYATISKHIDNDEA